MLQPLQCSCTTTTSHNGEVLSSPTAQPSPASPVPGIISQGYKDSNVFITFTSSGNMHRPICSTCLSLMTITPVQVNRYLSIPDYKPPTTGAQDTTGIQVEAPPGTTVTLVGQDR